MLMEKAVCFLSCMPCFDPSIAVALGLSISLQRDKESHNLCWAYHPVWEYISLFWPWCVLLFLLKQGHHISFRHASSFLYFRPHRRGVGNLCLQEERDVCRPLSCVSFGRNPTGCGGPISTNEADIALSLLFGSKPCFI